ncbi:MAG: ATP-binding protein [Nitrososphaeria archaeon]
MKCSICGKEAVRFIPYANIALCREHFIQWFEKRFFRHLEEYKILDGSRKVAVAVSGGKDSVTLLHLLKKASERYGFKLFGITIDLGIDRGTQYSRKSVEIAVSNFRQLNVDYEVVPLKESYGFTIDESKTKINRPVCSTCGLVKRYVMSEVAERNGADTLATGHNLDDMAQYVLSAYVHGDLEYVLRNGPVTPPKPGFPVKKVKPLFLTPEEEILHYALLNGFQFIYDPCPYSEEFNRVSKEKLGLIIKRVEKEYPGFAAGLVRTFEREIRPRLSAESRPAELGRCKICGRATSPGRDICSFCSIRIKLTGIGTSHNEARNS